MIERIDLPTGPFSATVQVPGDKSLGHRALVLSALAAGESRVAGLSGGADIRSTAAVIGGLGVTVEDDRVQSPGIAGWRTPAVPLDCGNSGTTMRLMTGALAGSGVAGTLVGDASLSRRPMRRVAAPLEKMGASIRLTRDGTAPIMIDGGQLVGTRVEIPIPSAQVRTAVALAALSADRPTVIESPPGYRDHTETWFEHLGHGRRVGETAFEVTPGPVDPLSLAIPGDPSSAAFLWAAAAVRPGSTVTTPGISLNPGRLGFLRALIAMGATVEVTPVGDVMGDPVGDVTLTSGPLHGVTLEGAEVAATVDELPLIAVLAAMADGVTVVSGAAELRAKESDRLDGSVRLARLAGAPARVDEDGFVVGEGPADATPAIAARGDHRIAMAAAIAAIAQGRPVEVEGFEVCAVSWPGFRTALEGLWS